MSRFFVGQRVRLVRACQPKNQGLTGNIRELHDEGLTEFGQTWNCFVDWNDGTKDDWGCQATHTDQLEPILDQHTPCEAEFKASLDKLLEGIPA